MTLHSLELVDHYRTEINEVFIDAQKKIADLLVDSADIIAERMEENPDGFTNNQLLEILKTTADRSGHGPTSTQKVEGTVVHATPRQIEEIKQKVRKESNGKTQQISQETNEVQLSTESKTIEQKPSNVLDAEWREVEGDRGSRVGQEAPSGTGTLSREAEAQGGEGEGKDLRTSGRAEAQAENGEGVFGLQD